MLKGLGRHHVPLKAFSDFSLVLTYALPEQALKPLVAPGLSLDTHDGFGFLAIGMMQARRLRPAFLPEALGLDFFLTGYRIFTRYRSASGRTLRGLQVLRSDTDRGLMYWLGNLLTRYTYRKADVDIQPLDRVPLGLDISIATADHAADVRVIADLSRRPAGLPPQSPFYTLEQARRFAGPLPHTFSYEEETRCMTIVQELRQEWQPRPVGVEVLLASYLDQPVFRGASPVLAGAFCVERVPYRWERGIVERVPEV